ncbi:MAG: hypothetical protein KKD77_23895 [Gammaproteobacteria bacterium]|nr:hypothetical protein [Gammaproteobacteria bacterium]
MAKVSAKGAVITLEDSTSTARTISSDVDSYEIPYQYPPQEVTGFGDGSNNFIPGLLGTGVTLNIHWNAAADTGAYTVIKSILGDTNSHVLSITPETGGPAWSGEVMCDGISISGSAAGSAIRLGSVHFSVMGSAAPTLTS